MKSMITNVLPKLSIVLALTAGVALTACKGSSNDIPEQKRMSAEAPRAEGTTPASTTGGEAAASVVPPGAPDWCKGHGLPESKCTKCNPQLTQGFKDSGDWCAEHEYPESACPTCNPQTPPEAATAVRMGSADDWCKGHGLPESKCTICNPELTQGFKDSGDWCEAHGYPESACPTCNPMTPPAQAANGGAGGTCGEHGGAGCGEAAGSTTH